MWVYLSVFGGKIQIPGSTIQCCSIISKIGFLKIFYLFIFKDMGREGEREGEKRQCVVASHVPCPGIPMCDSQARALTGNQTSDLWDHRLALSSLGHTSQC